MEPRKQDTSTGSMPVQTPILASASAPMADAGTPAQAKSASASIKPAEALSLLQADLHDLQKLGAKVAMMSRDGALFASIVFPGHAVGYQEGHITLDGAKVVS